MSEETDVLETVKAPIPPPPIPTTEERFGRSEEAVLLNAPLEVNLGGVDYKIKPPSIRRMLEWRREYVKCARKGDEARVKRESDPGALIEFGALTVIQDRVHLLFLFAPELPELAIMESATEEDILRAWEVIEGYASRPFLG